MLNLWSQIGRVGCRCRCPSCLTTKHKLVRRVSTAIATIRARPKTSSTFLYSAIFAAATVTDGHFKRQRRAHWDDALSEAYAQLAASQRAVQDHRKQSLTETHDLSKEEGARRARWDQSISEAYAQLKASHRAIQDHRKQSLTEPHSLSKDEAVKANAELKQESRDPTLPGGPYMNSHASLMDVENVIRYAPKPGALRPEFIHTTADYYRPWAAEHKPPEYLWSGDQQRTKAFLKVWTKKKIAKAEIASARLAVRLMLEIQLADISWINLDLLPEAVREIGRRSCDDQIQLLSDLDTDFLATATLEAWEGRRDATAKMRIPRYEHREDGSHYPIVEELNESVLGLLRAFKAQEISFVALVMKVAHNLLVSSVPPDLQTVNLLLLGFHGLGDQAPSRHQITDAVVQFCLSVRIRPNELTCATILATYIEQNKSIKFAQFIELMRAADGTRGIMLAKPGIRITESSQGRLVQHDELEHKVFQAVYPSPLILWQVIRGASKFSGIQAAIEISKNFVQMAWGLDRACLFELLRQCTKEEDWESGIWVWTQVEAFRRRHRKKDIASILGMMLALCVKCDARTEFHQIFSNALQQTYKLGIDQVTPVVLTDLVEEALWIVEHDHYIDGDDLGGENQKRRNSRRGRRMRQTTMPDVLIL